MPKPLILFSNLQWQVTRSWLEARKGQPYYPIEKKRLLKTCQYTGETLYDWPLHMAEKGWVNLGAFMEAFEFAVRHHYPQKLDEDMLQRTKEYLKRN